MLIFISGGARSGKSRFAEKMVKQDVKRGHLHYIATSRMFDHEMRSRIQHHQTRRNDEWKTWEKPTDLADYSKRFTNQDQVLVDCLTILVANELFNGATIQSPQKIHRKIVSTIKSFQHVKKLVVVSNDLFSDEIPDDEGTFTYMKLLGALHQEIVSISDEAYQVIHGLPMKMKG